MSRHRLVCAVDVVHHGSDQLQIVCRRSPRWGRLSLNAGTCTGRSGNSNETCYDESRSGVRTEWECPGISNCEAANGMQADDCVITSVTLVSGIAASSSTKCTPGGMCASFTCTDGNIPACQPVSSCWEPPPGLSGSNPPTGDSTATATNDDPGGIGTTGIIIVIVILASSCLVFVCWRRLRMRGERKIIAEPENAEQSQRGDP